MLITDARYFRPQIVNAIFRANDIIKEHEEVNKLTLLQSGETKEYKYYVFSVQYSDFRTQRHAPDHIQLKISLKGASRAKREFDFYERILAVMKRRVDKELLRFPVCYDAYYDDASDQFHLILDDTSQEFTPSRDNAPPTARHREHLMDTLASLHAYWWEHPLLEELDAMPSEETIDNTLEGYQSKLAEIKKSVGKYLKTEYLDILDKIASGLPQKRRERLITNKGLTVIHNNLLPENIVHSTREVRIINWQDWAIGISTDDLAKMIPLNWPAHVRQFQEKQLLKRYYDTICKRGVSNYSWEDFEYDYNASLAQVIGTLLNQWTLDEHTRGHWRTIETAIQSFIAMDTMSIYR